MKFGKISAIAVAMAVFATSYQPAQAFVAKPAPVAPQVTEGDVIEVGRRRFRRGFRRGHRGFRHRRHRRGAYIAGGLIAGALIGSALAAPRYYGPRYRYYDAPRRAYRPRRVRVGRAHENWCYNRYRSYRAYDNTFQPYHGPRRGCYSPYR